MLRFARPSVRKEALRVPAGFLQPHGESFIRLLLCRGRKAGVAGGLFHLHLFLGKQPRACATGTADSRCRPASNSGEPGKHCVKALFSLGDRDVLVWVPGIFLKSVLRWESRAWYTRPSGGEAFLLRFPSIYSRMERPQKRPVLAGKKAGKGEFEKSFKFF